MVSIHRVPVNVLLIISVVYLTFRFKREALHYCSLHVLRLVGMAIAIETSNAKAHADMYVHSYNSNLLMISGYTISSRNEVCKNTPTGHSHCFVLDCE